MWNNEHRLNRQLLSQWKLSFIIIAVNVSEGLMNNVKYASFKWVHEYIHDTIKLLT